MRPLSTHRANSPQIDATLRALRRSARRKRQEVERALAALQQLEHTHADRVAAGDHADAQIELQELEAQLAETRELVESLAQDAIERLARVYDQAPAYRSAHSELADLCWRLLAWAEAHGDRRGAARYLELLTRYDDGRYVDLIEGTATLELDSDPDGAEITLYPLIGDRQLGAPRRLGTTPLPPTDLTPGAYVVELDAPGFAPTRRPLTLRRGSDAQLEITLFREREIGPDFAYVPGGTFVSGAQREASPQREIFIDNFAIARSPVTCGEYRRFLDAIADEDPGQALAFAPRAANSQDPRQPVTGVSAEAAEAYCRWLSQERGAALRLPSAAEREKAEQQVEGRFAAPRQDSRARAPQLATAIRAERASLYGVRATSSAEWTTEQLDAELTPELAPPILGFRLLRELPSGGSEQLDDAVVPDALETNSELDQEQPNEPPEARPETQPTASPDAPRPLAAVVPIGRALTRARARAGPR